MKLSKLPRRLRARRRFRRNVLGVTQPAFPVPFICGATRSGTTLMRLMLDAHPEMAIGGETHFVVPMLKAVRPPGAERGRARGDGHHGRALGRLPPLRGRAPRALPERRPAELHRRGARLLPPLRRAPGQGALGRQDPRLRAGDGAPAARVRRGALRPHDPRRPRRRDVGGAAGVGPEDDRGRGPAVEAADRAGARAAAQAEPLHRGPLRGPDHRHRGGAAPRLRVHRAASSTR